MKWSELPQSVKDTLLVDIITYITKMEEIDDKIDIVEMYDDFKDFGFSSIHIFYVLNQLQSYGLISFYKNRYITRTFK